MASVLYWFVIFALYPGGAGILGQVLKKPYSRQINRIDCPPYLHDFYRIKKTN